MNTTAVLIVVALIAVTLVLTSYASRRNNNADDHYVASSRIGGWQNGLALAGDQLSAAALLGITGAVALGGFDGFYLAVGVPAAYLLMLLVIAEPLRNLGRYTLADAVAARFDGRGLRGVMALSTLVISIIYMVIQFIGAGLLAQLLLGVSFPVAVLVIGTLMTVYTFLGGMVGTTYIQVFKAVLLIGTVFALLVLVTVETGGNPLGSMQEAASRFGAEVIAPRHGDLTGSLDTISLLLGMVLGMMGLPHVMVRFLTVRNGRAARQSIQVAMWIYAFFFCVLPIFGYAALNLVGRDAIRADNEAGNLAAPRLAETLGGNLLFAIVAGVVMTTILAVLAGLSIASSGAVAHDLYTTVLRRGAVSRGRQLLVGRVAGAAIAVIAMLVAFAAKTLNVAFLGNVAFSVAASTTMPVLLLTMYWRRFNRRGAVAGLVGGLVSAVGLVLLGPDVLGAEAVFPLTIPALVSVPFGFLCAWLGSLAGRGDPAAAGTDYDQIARRAFAARRES
ncbi:solute symporter family protein [Amycolatopsis cihanbeyliensis]|uniref:SSS family solute:Na+ symporter/cation/acetate symporter n=1 Tax=Amycolatopsis cihanbeyliensis TaxID=1128664 RepID=A0A542CSF2_AMYCI|nr:cation acetate symporter [Amycolatopsis cihanbeyliensis]TQI93755.1 SSS family solute:Na+ symporter/cation/acetate symporter [Amycolatopsis cihanbeyliensis]